MPRIISFVHKHFGSLQLGVFVLSAIVILLRPVTIFKDSYGYMEASLIRLPVYPIFLKVMRFVFGESYQFATLVTQMLFIFGAIYFFIKIVRKHIQIPTYWFLGLTIILLAPCLYDTHIANSILSEAISYALFLITVGYLIEGIADQRTAQFYKAAGLVLVLLLTRGQFLFLLPVALLSVIWHLSHVQRTWKTWLLPIVILVVPLLSSIIEKNYHLQAHGVYVSTPWTGIHVATAPLYLASPEDVSVFTSEEEKAFFNFAIDRIQTKELSSYQEDGTQIIDAHFYTSHFTKIANWTLFLEGKEFVGAHLSDQEKLIQLDKLTKKMTVPLIQKNPKAWTELYVKNFIHAFGTTKELLLWLLILVVVGWRMILKKTKEHQIIVFSLLLVFANAATLSIGIMTIKRYLFYNDWVFFLIVFILLHSFIPPKKTS